jgi:hypothetical protein
MAPTYNLGGSDSSHTRQGGINILIRLVMVAVLLVRKIRNREDGASAFTPAGYLINFGNIILFKPLVFSTPKVLRP